MNIGNNFMKLKTFKMLSVVIPCYNEEENIPIIVSKFCKILEETDQEIEVILVNNGSIDNSKNIFAQNISNANQDIKVLNIEKNIGYGHGILSGLKIAKGDVLAWTHADLQTDPADVLVALNKYNKYNDSQIVVKGKRRNRNLLDSFFTWGMQVYCTIILKTKLNDINAQPKLFSKLFFDQHFSLAPHDFSLDLFLLIKAKKFGLIKTIDVKFNKRKYGEAKGGGTIKGKFKLIERTLDYIKNLKNNDKF